MAIQKVGLIYYNVETNRYQDIKIKRLKKDFGCHGLAVYDYILCEIYRVKGCFIMWDDSTAFDVAEYFGLKETLVNEIVNYCCTVGLFNKELYASGRVLTSLSIQNRYSEICKRAKRRGSEIPEELLIIPEETNIPPEKSRITPEECDKVKESKVKESKVKESKVKRVREHSPLSKTSPIIFPKEKKKKIFTPEKIFKPPSLDEVKNFFNERGQPEESAKTAFEFYSLADWHDSQGNPVLNWQQKMISWINREQKKHQNGNQHGTGKQIGSHRAVVTGTAESAGQF